MSRLDQPVESGRNRIRQRFESARRADDHNVGLHTACNLHRARAARRVIKPNSLPAPLPPVLSRAPQVWLNLAKGVPLVTDSGGKRNKSDVAISDCWRVARPRVGRDG